MNLMSRIHALVLLTGRALVLDVRGSADITVPILMGAAGVATVGVIVPTMFQSGTTAANTMQSQASALQQGATGGGSASGGLGNLTSTLSSSLGGGSSGWNVSVGSNGVSVSGDGIKGSFGSSGVSVSASGGSSGGSSAGATVSGSGGSLVSGTGGGSGSTTTASGGTTTATTNTVTPQQAAIAQQALNNLNKVQLGGAP